MGEGHYDKSTLILGIMLKRLESFVIFIVSRNTSFIRQLVFKVLLLDAIYLVFGLF